MSDQPANPLLEARQRLLAAEPDTRLYGKAARRLERKRRQQQTERIALTALEKYLPRLFHSPPHMGLFEQGWTHFLEGLGLACESETRYRDALNLIVKLLHLGNSRQCWSLPLPTLALEVRRTPQRQTETWFANSGAALQAHQQWMLQVDDTGATGDSSRLLADILHSAAMHSGLNRATLLYQLAHAINRRERLWHNGQLVWLALTTDDPQLPTNASGDKGQHHEWRFIPALPTLGLLYRWYRGHHRCTLPDNLPAFDLWFRPLLHAPLGSLTALARHGSIVAECLPGVAWPQILVNVANGTLPSVSLPHAHWIALHQVELPSLASLAQVPLTGASVFDTAAPSPTARRHTKMHSPFLQQLREAITERSSATTKMTKQACQQALQAIASTALCLPEQILLGWFCHGLIRRRNKPSTLRTYLSRGGVQWLSRCHGHDIAQWTGETWLAHYQALLEEYRNPAIDNTPLDDQPIAASHPSYVAERLMHLHHYAVQHHGIDPLPESLLDGVRQRPHVRAGFLSEPLFNTLLQTLATHPGINGALRESLVLITLIAGRAGLRLSELIKLRVQDIDDHPDLWLRIRNTPLDDGKSDSARRNIPLGGLLSANEAARLQQYVEQMHRRHGKIPHALLFPSEAGVKIPLNPQAITAPVIQLLRACSQQPWVFHHLRHSALCRLQLALHHDELDLHDAPDELWRNLLPWDRDHCRSIIQNVTGNHAARLYWALAQFAGHQGPDTTLKSYLHLCDWVSARCLHQAQYDWSLAQRRYFTGLSEQQLRATGLDQGPLSYDRCWPQIQQKLHRHLYPQAIRLGEIAPLPAPAKRKADFFAILEVLRRIEQSENVKGMLDSYDIPIPLLNEWIAKAKALGRLQTRRKRSRLLSEKRQRALLPGAPRSHGEQQELPSLVKKARLLFRRHRAELTWWLRYLLTHTTTSRHGVSFRDPAALSAFISTTVKLLPATRLTLTLYGKKADKANWTKGLAKGLDIEHHFPPSGSRQQSRATLRIRHPDEQAILAKHHSGPNPTYQCYSTPVLSLLGYIISVQLFTLEDINGWSDEMIEAEAALQ